MKKFYFLALTVVFALTSFLAKAQVYNSITANPNGYTLDDPRFWQGGVPPPNPCNNCTIKIFSSATMAQEGGNTSSTANVFTTQVPVTTAGQTDGPGGITVGMKFQAAAGAANSPFVSGVRFYKLPNMTGTHTGVLYNAGGGPALATVTFGSETASGWQDQKFATPIAITPGATYIIAVFMANSYYADDDHGLDAAITGTSGWVSSVAGLPGNNNGVYNYGATPTFPTISANNANYWVDADVLIDGTFLNDVVLNNSTINLYGNTTFTLNTYLQLFNSSITLGNDPVSTEGIKLNDQLDLNGTSAIQLANDLTFIDANDIGLPIVGPHDDLFNPGFKSPGIFGIIPPDDNGYAYTFVLNQNNIGTSDNQYQPGGFNYYQINCDPGDPSSSNTCGVGLVYGPAITTAQAPYGVIFIGSTTLPVQLVQFLASKGADGSVNLSWSTSQEVNAGYYDVERSGDQSGWTKIGSVKAKGNSSITTNYSYSDKLPLDGVGYYRLKMVDLDGKFVYSKTVSVTSDKNTTPLVVYNNPFTDLIRIKVNVSRSQTLTMTVSDMMGKTYIQQSYQAQAGDNLVNLQPAVIGGSGMYILRISGDTYNQTVKLEKQ